MRNGFTSSQARLVHKRKRMSSARPCDPICKPIPPVDKWTQAVKSLIVSRANPTFCVYCKKKTCWYIGGISCSAHDPVASTDAGGLANSSAPRVPSKCNDCVVMNVHRESSILERILHAIIKKMTKLCPAHQLPDSIPPAPQSTLD